MQPYINIWHTFQWLFTVMYLHDLITNSCTKCMEMLSGLFPIQTNLLISFQEQSSVLLHQGTTFKELLSLVFYRKRAVVCKVSLTFTFMHQVTLTFEDADVPPNTGIWGQEWNYIRSPWHYIHASGRPDIWGCRCIFCRMQLRRQWTLRTLRNLWRLMCFCCCCCCCCCYCWMLLFLLFIFDCGSTTIAEQEQQQHYKVTTIWIQAKRLHNLCRLIYLLLLLLGNFVLVYM